MTKPKKKPEGSSEPWVTQNIQTYGNSLVPNELIEEYGIETTEKIISYAAGMKVKIEERYPIEEPDYWDFGKPKISKKKIYIASIER